MSLDEDDASMTKATGAKSIVVAALMSYLHGMPPRIEVCLRITLSSFLGYCLSVANLPAIIPPYLSYMLGLVAATASISVPSLMFGVGAAFPSAIVMVLLALGGSSLLLCAAVVSDGFFIAVVAVYTLWISGLKYGPFKGQTASYATIGIVVAGLLALSFRELVQDGFSYTINTAPADGHPLAETLKTALSELCKTLGQAENCWENQLPVPSETVEVVIPGDGSFAGRTAIITPGEGTINIRIPGGLWIIASLWKWRGIDNPLANNRNFLIVIFWAIVCVAVGILAPPFRTARSAVTRGLLPATLKDIAALCQSAPGSDLNVEGDDEDKQGRVGRLIHSSNTFSGGNIAVLTAFEPRLCTAPFECSWTKLKDLIGQVEKEIFLSIGADSLRLKDNGEEEAASIDAVGAMLAKCATALAQNEDPSENLVALVQKEAPEGDDGSFDFTRRFVADSQNVLKATIAWLNAMLHPDSPLPCTKAGMKNIMYDYGPWLTPPFSLLKGMFHSLTIPFRPKLWDAGIFIGTLEFSLGYVALVIMEVYWKKYSDFALDVDDTGVDGLYSGWSLVSYGVCWTETYEGTVKLSVQRTLGTCAGGFFAWLGIIVASGSYDEQAEINPYGLVAWLTITTGIAAYFSVEPGFAARLGMSPDNGKMGMYFIMTQALIALETQAGSGARNNLTVNRIIATASGCVMACIIAMLPPRVKANDPGLVLDLVLDMKGSLQKCLRLLLSEHESRSVDIDKEKDQCYERVLQERKLALSRFKDASKMKRWPFLRMDPKLTVLVEEVSVAGVFVMEIFDLSSAIAKSEHLAAAFAPGTSDYEEVTKIIDRLGDESMKPGPTPDSPKDDDDAAAVATDDKLEEADEVADSQVAAAERRDDDISTFMALVNQTVASLESRETVLLSMMK